MTEEKYKHFVKSLSFKDYGPGSYRQGIKMSSDFLGLDVNIEYGVYWAAGKIGGESSEAHVHDFDQVMFWLGGDTNEMGELGAEIELCLGEERERHMITTTSAVFVPKGFVHFPASITRMDKRFLFMMISCAPVYKETPVSSGTVSIENTPVAGWGAKHRERIIHPAFIRKGAWSYGPRNQDDSGGALATIRGKDFDTMILCESLKKAPYRFGPVPDKPHVHSKPEILFFMGADTNDLSVLGGELEMTLGEEQERYIITAPTAVVVPGGLAHNPLTVLKISKPFIMIDVRPYGVTGMSANLL